MYSASSPLRLRPKKHMTNSAFFDFNANYFELPFTNDLKPVASAAQGITHTIVYVRECTRGYMIFSAEHKHFLFKNAKQCKQLIDALDVYAAQKSESAILQYTLSAAGIPQYKAAKCTDGRYWIVDITGYSFMEATWNGKSITEASNPFLTLDAEGEAEKSTRAEPDTSEDLEPRSKRKPKDA